MNQYFNDAIGWTKKPTSPRFVYPTAAKFCCCLPYKARRGCDRLFTYVSTQAKKRKRLFANRITTLLILKTSFDQNSQITFFLYLQNVLAPGGEDLLTDDEEEEIHSSNPMKKCSRETAKLLPSDKNRMDSFEAELEDNTAV